MMTMWLLLHNIRCPFHLLCFVSLNLWLIQGLRSVDRRVTDAGNGLLFLVGGGKLDNWCFPRPKWRSWDWILEQCSGFRCCHLPPLAFMSQPSHFTALKVTRSYTQMMRCTLQEPRNGFPVRAFIVWTAWIIWIYSHSFIDVRAVSVVLSVNNILKYYRV